MHAFRLLPLALFAFLAAGCGGGSPPAPVAGAGSSSTQEAVARAGDVSVRASVVPTSTLDEAVARNYGIERSDSTALLLVSVRKGPDGADVSVPARVEARVSNLGGQAELLDMRELRSGELLDYVGTVTIDPPDTLRFDLRVTREDGTSSTLQFTREFYPR